MYRACLAGMLAGCGHEYALSSLGEALPPTSSGASETPAQPADLPIGDPAQTLAVIPNLDLQEPEDLDPEDLDPAIVPEDLDLTFGGDAKVSVADYLFVVDSSSSMQRLLGRVLDGFDALASQGVFPQDARIAVMNTLPAEKDDRGLAHLSAPQDPWIRSEPGFGHLVDAQRIAAFRAVAPPHIAERFEHDGCGAWFSPTQSNATGIPCLVANTQLALYPYEVEAGLTAVAQLIQSDKPIFRTGAAVNVIIVSDTHDPGLPKAHPLYADLVAMRPSFADIERLALRRQDLASFRLHAIAPAEVCTAEDWTGTGPVYFEAAHVSGGEYLDVCDAKPDEYIDLVRRIAEKGAIPQRPVLPVSRIDEIDQILVDGQPVAFDVSGDKQAVVLKDLSLSEPHGVSVRYRRPAEIEEAAE